MLLDDQPVDVMCLDNDEDTYYKLVGINEDAIDNHIIHDKVCINTGEHEKEHSSRYQITSHQEDSDGEKIKL